MRRVLVLVVVLGAALGCAGPQRRPDPPRGVLVVTSPSPGASLWIDEKLVGEVRALGGGVRLAAGAHRVELRLDGYHTRYAEVTVPAGRTQTLALELTEEQP